MFEAYYGVKAFRGGAPGLRTDRSLDHSINIEAPWRVWRCRCSPSTVPMCCSKRKPSILALEHLLCCRDLFSLFDFPFFHGLRVMSVVQLQYSLLEQCRWIGFLEDCEEWRRSLRSVFLSPREDDLSFGRSISVLD